MFDHALEDLTPDQMVRRCAFHVGNLAAVARLGNHLPPNWLLDLELQKLEQQFVAKLKRPELFVSIVDSLHELLMRAGDDQLPAAVLTHVFGLNRRRLLGYKTDKDALFQQLDISLDMASAIPSVPQRSRCIGLAAYHGGIICGEMFGCHDEAAVWHRRGAESDREAGNLGGAAISSFCAVLSDLRHAEQKGYDMVEPKQRLLEEYARFRKVLADTTNEKHRDWRDRSGPEWMQRYGLAAF
jgi:hypothetical protein